MRLSELQSVKENYFTKIKTDAKNLLMSLIAQKKDTIDTNEFINELSSMGHNVTVGSLQDLLKDSNLIQSVNDKEIKINNDVNLTTYSDDGKMDNEKVVDKLASKSIAKSLK